MTCFCYVGAARGGRMNESVNPEGEWLKFAEKRRRSVKSSYQSLLNIRPLNIFYLFMHARITQRLSSM